ncbi:geranylgeranyl diphosphate reductase [Blastomonas sp. CCH5-A3]|jgi:geranylgeranyl reductase|uniref:geranylgeranyl diphosphate reductase n=1 Tax=Blastomonas sp. CCH5-A3 TaxID=1768761 RepID=UPI0008257FC7|nr:geranylgeranyl diphosphate reductase [Blastomonas sp. CCH5-A3]MAF62354.1 geranylgeranyl diphosphate reductase [Blastomonas sp.]|tara:strand:+ start:44530 stop:45741 length:1212 start_codon:yes stop_codon:yes gene_type:complete
MAQADFDVAVIGGGPSGATAANDLARRGLKVLLLDRDGRIKPCGGAIPPRLLKDFEIPESLLVAKARAARMIAPSGREVDMPVGDGPEGKGFVGMVDRDVFDEWLRERARQNGATRITGTYEKIDRDSDGMAVLVYRQERGGPDRRLRVRSVIGADGARSSVAKQNIPGAKDVKCVFAYHEIVKAPEPAVAAAADFDPDRCDVYYQGHLSPDFYAWIFPHGKTASIGLGSAHKGFPLRETTALMRRQVGLEGCETIRTEGAPIPLKPLKRWDNGRDIVVAGDAAGVVAPASGEGIYYAMACGRLAADAVYQFLATGKASALRQARKAFMAKHGKVFWILGMMQYFWYSSDKRRERFVKMCADPDVQYLTWQSYMHKELVRRKPVAHAKIFVKDMGHLLGLSRA